MCVSLLLSVCLCVSISEFVCVTVCVFVYEFLSARVPVCLSTIFIHTNTYSQACLLDIEETKPSILGHWTYSERSKMEAL